MTRIGTLITALFLVVASPAHALTFHFLISGTNGGFAEGLITGLEDSFLPAVQSADSVMVTASSIGGLGEYVPALVNAFIVTNGAIVLADFTSFKFLPPFQFVGIPLIFAIEGPDGTVAQFGDVVLGGFRGPITFSAVPEVPLPAALPLFATGLGALGLLTWRRKRKAVAA